MNDKPTVLALLNHIGDQEKHFNGLETQYRLLASTWLLASFGAIGYAHSNIERIDDRWLVTGLIGVAGGIGISLLWVLDSQVYHRLLSCVFLQGVLLEQEHDWLPRIRTDMLMSQETGDVTSRTANYYISSAGFELVVATAGFTMYLESSLAKTTVMATGIGIFVALRIYILRAGASPRARTLFNDIDGIYHDPIMIAHIDHRAKQSTPT